MENEEYNQYKNFILDNIEEYDQSHLDIAQVLAEEGLTFHQLLTINLNPDNPDRLVAIKKDNYSLLRTFAFYIKEINLTDYDKRVIDIVCVLLHEFTYSLISRDSNDMYRFRMDMRDFAYSSILETVIAEIKCPVCNNNTLLKEHLQHRGDIFCMTCKSDFDVKKSINACRRHRKKYLKGDRNAINTRYCIYTRVKDRNVNFYLLDCKEKCKDNTIIYTENEDKLIQQSLEAIELFLSIFRV